MFVVDAQPGLQFVEHRLALGQLVLRVGRVDLHQHVAFRTTLPRSTRTSAAMPLALLATDDRSSAARLPVKRSTSQRGQSSTRTVSIRAAAALGFAVLPRRPPGRPCRRCCGWACPSSGPTAAPKRPSARRTSRRPLRQRLPQSIAARDCSAAWACSPRASLARRRHPIPRPRPIAPRPRRN